MFPGEQILLIKLFNYLWVREKSNSSVSENIFPGLHNVYSLKAFMLNITVDYQA